MELVNRKELDFILNFNEKKVEEILPHIIEEYVSLYGEEYREEITKKTQNITVATYFRMYELYHIVSMLEEKLKAKINREFYQILGVKNTSSFYDVEREQKSSNIPYLKDIVRISKENKINSFVDNNSINILKVQIKDYFVNLLDKSYSTDEEYKRILEIISFIDELVKEYDDIHNTYSEHYKKSEEYNRNIKSIGESLNKEFVRKIEFMLSEKDKDIINNNPSYDIKELEAYELLFYGFNSTLGFSSPIIDEKSSEYKRKKILKYLNCDDSIDPADYKKFISTISSKFLLDKNGNILHYFSSIIGIYKKCYDKKIKEEGFRIFSGTSDIIDKYIPNDVENSKEISSYVIKDIEKLKKRDDIHGTCGIFNDKETIHILMCIILYCTKNFNEINDIFLSAMEAIIHECGHSVGWNLKKDKIYGGTVTYDGIYSYIKSPNLRTLNELMVQYFTYNVLDSFNEKNKIHISDSYKLGCFHTRFFFFIESFGEYIDLFKRARMESDVNVLIEFMGEDNFEEYVNLLNDTNMIVRDEKSNKILLDKKEELNDIVIKVRKRQEDIRQQCNSSDKVII